MFARSLAKPSDSVFLLGPRGLGKSTWLKEHFAEFVTYDLLDTSLALRLSGDPSLLFEETHHLPEGSWIVLDEVQKVPGLLNEVHRLIEQRRLRFVLCGSSARKLRRSGVNLLAGRAKTLTMFPLVSAEVDFIIEPSNVLHYGTLPMAYRSREPVEYLSACAETYLREEVRFEALTRNIGAFSRFLEVASLHNGSITNLSNMAREAQVARQTVSSYFEILVDTLVGYWLPAWKLKRATKQIAAPKFYFFDSGVARAVSGRLPYPPSREELGPLFETYILHEVRAFLAYSGKHYPLFFWGTHHGAEVDILTETRSGYVAIELKSGVRWDKRYNRGLMRLSEVIGQENVRCYGVYLGDRRLTSGTVTVLPCPRFLEMLWSGDLID